MKLKGAMTVLLKEIDFLGFKNLGELVKDMDNNPLAYNNSAIQALKVYKEEAYR